MTVRMVERPALAGLTITQLESLLADVRASLPQLPSREELVTCFERMSQAEIARFAADLRDRLLAETRALDHLLADGLDPLVEETELRLPFPIVRVPMTEIAALGPAAGASRASYRDGVIYAADELPGLRDRLIAFAERGVLGHDLIHEAYHGFQGAGDLITSATDLVDRLDWARPSEARVALLEAHAWFCCLRGFRGDVLADAIARAYHIGRRELLIRALANIRALVALGYSTRTVATLVGAARWDAETGTYPSLEDEIRQAATRQGLALSELPDLIARQELFDRIEALRAMGIARVMMASVIR